MKIDDEIIKRLAEIMKDNDIAELEYKVDAISITMKKASTVSEQLPQIIQSHVSPCDNKVEEKKVIEEPKGTHVNSPMVGTCYLAPEPGAPKYVTVGDVVQKDQPLLIIEAMKVMNLIKSPVSGKVTKIAVADAEPVEYGQLLVVIE